MSRADAVTAASLSAQLGYACPPGALEPRLARLGASPDDGLFGAELADRLVGWIHVQSRLLLQAERFAEIAGLVVDEAVRGRGIGRALVAAAEAWAARQGHQLVRVRSNVSRERAHGFYRDLGYALRKTSHLFSKASPAGPDRPAR